jgi:hypothetical protein
MTSVEHRVLEIAGLDPGLGLIMGDFGAILFREARRLGRRH